MQVLVFLFRCLFLAFFASRSFASSLHLPFTPPPFHSTSLSLHLLFTLPHVHSTSLSFHLFTPPPFHSTSSLIRGSSGRCSSAICHVFHFVCPNSLLCCLLTFCLFAGTGPTATDPAALPGPPPAASRTPTALLQTSAELLRSASLNCCRRYFIAATCVVCDLGDADHAALQRFYYGHNDDVRAARDLPLNGFTLSFPGMQYLVPPLACRRS
jgi:hypothetical protein